MRSMLTGALLTCLLANGVSAGPIAVPDFSFEAPDVADETALVTFASGASFPDGWTTRILPGSSSAAFLLADPADGAYPSSTGNALPLPGAADGFQAAGISLLGTSRGFFLSDVVATTEMNAVYTLTVAIGNRLDSDPGGVSISLVLDNVPIATSGTGGDLLAEGAFTDLSISYTAPVAGQELRLRLAHNGTGAGTFLADFDNVRLSADLPDLAVPEPMTLASFAAGLLGLGVTVTRRRRRPVQRP